MNIQHNFPTKEITSYADIVPTDVFLTLTTGMTSWMKVDGHRAIDLSSGRLRVFYPGDQVIHAHNATLILE